MALLLSERTMLDYLLNEAPSKPAKPVTTDSDDTNKPDADPKTPDTDSDADGSTKDTAADTADVTSNDEPPPVDAMAAHTAMQPDNDRRLAAAAVPGGDGVEIDDTPQNREYMLDKYQEVMKIYSNLLEFVNNVIAKFPNDVKRVKILNQIVQKIEFNEDMLRRALEDQIFINMDLSSIFALYKIYFNDANTVMRTVRVLVSYRDVS